MTTANRQLRTALKSNHKSSIINPKATAFSLFSPPGFGIIVPRDTPLTNVRQMSVAALRGPD